MPDEAQRLDAADPLAFARERFRLPDGAHLSRRQFARRAAEGGARRARRRRSSEQWGEDLIASWNKHGWIDWPQRIAAKLAPIVGAKPNEVLDRRFDQRLPVQAARRGGARSARSARSLTQKRQFPDRPLCRAGRSPTCSACELEGGRPRTRSMARDRRRHGRRHSDPRRLSIGRDLRHARGQRRGARGRRARPSGTCRTAPARSSSTSTAPAATSRSAAATNI